MKCEICGSNEAIFLIKVEGTILKVCSSCARYGKIIGKIGEVKEENITEEKEIVEKEYEIVEDYAERIRKAREKLGLSIEEFCRKFGFKESTYRKIEEGKLVPDLKTARKLEKILGVKLIEEVKYHYYLKEEKKEEEYLTLGDIVEIK